MPLQGLASPPTSNSGRVEGPPVDARDPDDPPRPLPPTIARRASMSRTIVNRLFGGRFVEPSPLSTAIMSNERRPATGASGTVSEPSPPSGFAAALFPHPADQDAERTTSVPASTSTAWRILRMGRANRSKGSAGRGTAPGENPRPRDRDSGVTRRQMFETPVLSCPPSGEEEQMRSTRGLLTYACLSPLSLASGRAAAADPSADPPAANPSAPAPSPAPQPTPRLAAAPGSAAALPVRGGRRASCSCRRSASTPSRAAAPTTSAWVSGWGPWPARGSRSCCR